MTEKLCLSVAEAAEMVGIGRTKMYELVASGKVSSFTLDRRRLVPVAGLKQWVAEHIVEGGT